MGLKLLELVWSIFTSHDVNYGQILRDDFLQYIPKESPREIQTKLTFARFKSLCISDLHADARLSMGNDISLFITKDLKKYNPSKDQSLFGPIRRLPVHILSTLGLETPDVSDHIEATEGIDPYLPTPPLPTQQIVTSTKPTQPESTATPSTTTSHLSLAKTLKQLVKANTGPRNISKKHTTPTKKKASPKKVKASRKKETCTNSSFR